MGGNRPSTLPAGPKSGGEKDCFLPLKEKTMSLRTYKPPRLKNVFYVR